MRKEKIWKIVSLIMAIFCLVNCIYLNSKDNEIKKVNKILYEADHLSVEDLEHESAYKASTTIGDEATGEIEVKYKKLYGIERVAEFELDKEEGIEVTFLSGDSAKILIFDENGNERFYREVSELYFEPGESGIYKVYVVGNEFTGELVLSTYYIE